MKVKLMSYTQNPIEIIYKAYRTCYSKHPPTQIKTPTESEMCKFIKKYIHHESPLEHVSFTFSIEGVSRSLSHQLVRHRLASYSQKSQRYVLESNFEYVVPSSIMNHENPLICNMYHNVMETIKTTYETFINKGIPKEDARYILTNANTTDLVMTMNLREFRYFYAERSCNRAQWEIRELAELLMNEVKPVIQFADYRVKKCGTTCFECDK